MDVTVSRDIEAEPGAVWAVITDLEGSPDVLSAVRRVERLDDRGTFGVGTRWRETRTMFGREATEEMQVTEVDDGTSYTVAAASGSTNYSSTLRVVSLAAGRSRLTMTFGADPSGFGAKLLGATLGRLFLGATRKMLARDLADIATTAESPRDDPRSRRPTP